MYLPKSQVTVKTTAGDQFIIKQTGKNFVGNYLETNRGKRYAGTNHMKLGVELIPIPGLIKKSTYINQDVEKYNVLKEKINKFLSNTIEIPSMKRYPSENDYEKGFFRRYFSRRINGSGYQEIDKEVYDSISKKEKKYDHNLYEVGSIRWSLRGNVFKDNALSLKEKEKNYKNISYLFPIFDEFSREPVKNQENLYTEGGELYYGNGLEYIGPYHIHTTNGPMVGAYHVDAEHSKLYYTNELPTPPNMSYEDFMANYPPITPSQPVLPIRETPDRGTITNVDPPPPPYTGESYNCETSWGSPPPGYQGLSRSSDGLVIIGSACVDPGDGTGTYNPGNYGNRFHQACSAQCEGNPVPNDTSGGVGCKMPWDPNYCVPCTVHDQNMCANSYSTGGGGGGGGGGYGSGGTISTGDCFIGKTSIIMGDETIKRIDEIKIGDIVKSEINTSNVIGIDIHKEKEYTIYSINNSEAFVTAEHPFKTTTGWKAIDPLETFKTHGIESNILEIGDILITKEGTEEVKSINQSTQTANIVYNLQLDNEHVYYANKYLVHNNKLGGAWSLDDIENIQHGLAVATCPCGMWNGVMQYSQSCC